MVNHLSVLDHTYGALAHGTRRAMLERLAHGSLRVTELAAPFDISLPAVSKHVRALEGAGLLSRDISGRDHVLSLRAAPLRPAAEWIDTYRSFWIGRLDALEAHLEERR